MDFTKFESKSSISVLIKEYLEQGYSTNQIRRVLNIEAQKLQDIIKSNSFIVINQKRHFRVNDNYLDNIDTEKKAYILGFIIADGSIGITPRVGENSKRLTFFNSIDDREALELIQSEISPDTPIRLVNNQSGVKFRKEQNHLRINSKQICNTLINKYHIMVRKTIDTDFIFDFNHIPIELHRHFVRGFFDGDGCVALTKSQNSINFEFSFVFTALGFTSQIATLFEETFDIKSSIKEHIGKTANWYVLRFNCSRDRTRVMKRIYSYFYDDSTCFLSRKKEKFNQYFEYRANSRVNKIE